MSSESATRVEKMLGELLRGRSGAGSSAFSALKHDEDLVPAVLGRVGAFLDHTDVRRVVAADVQGPQDSGGDVVVRISPEDGPSEYFVFQIKSHRELGESGVAQLLLAQHSRALDAYNPMIRYFILPFGVAERIGTNADGSAKFSRSDRRNIIQVISRHFVKKPEVSIIEPAYLAAFLKLSGSRIDAFVRATLGDNDPVRKAAMAEVNGLTLSQVRVLARCVGADIVPGASPLTIDDLTSDGAWVDAAVSGQRYYDGEVVYEDWPMDPRDVDPFQLAARDLEALEDVIYSDDSGKLRYVARSSPGVVALGTDGHVRFSHSGNDLADYLIWTLNADPLPPEPIEE